MAMLPMIVSTSYDDQNFMSVASGLFKSGLLLENLDFPKKFGHGVPSFAPKVIHHR